MDPVEHGNGLHSSCSWTSHKLTPILSFLSLLVDHHPTKFSNESQWTHFPGYVGLKRIRHL